MSRSRTWTSSVRRRSRSGTKKLQSAIHSACLPATSTAGKRYQSRSDQGSTSRPKPLRQRFLWDLRTLEYSTCDGRQPPLIDARHRSNSEPWRKLCMAATSELRSASDERSGGRSTTRCDHNSCGPTSGGECCLPHNWGAMAPIWVAGESLKGEIVLVVGYRPHLAFGSHEKRQTRGVLVHRTSLQLARCLGGVFRRGSRPYEIMWREPK